MYSNKRDGTQAATHCPKCTQRVLLNCGAGYDTLQNTPAALLFERFIDYTLATLIPYTTSVTAALTQLCTYL